MPEFINQALEHEWIVVGSNGRVIGGKDDEQDAIILAKKYTLSGGQTYFIMQNKLRISNTRITITEDFV